MKTLRPYLKYLSRNKLYTAVSLFGLAIALMFVTVLLRYVERENSVDSFHANKDRIYMLCSPIGSNVPSPFAAYVKDLLPEVEDYVRVTTNYLPLGDASSEKSLNAKTLLADSNFFSVFSFKLLEGDAKTVLQNRNSIVLTKAAANRLFPEGYKLGDAVPFVDRSFVLSGIMDEIPENSSFVAYDAVIPYTQLSEIAWEQALISWGTCNYAAYFLVREGADIRAKEDLLLEHLKKDFWLYRDGYRETHEFKKLKDLYYDEHVSAGQYECKTGSKGRTNLLMGIALLILFMASLNYLGMSIAQAGPRSREVALKKMLGSSRASIVRQFLTESFIMTIIAVALALLLAFAFERNFDQLLNSKLYLAKALSSPVGLLIVLGITISLSLLTGILPALITSTIHAVEVVKGTFRRKVKTRYSSLLMAVQYCIAIALLIASAVVIQQTNYLHHAPLGFRSKGIIVANVAGRDSASLNLAAERLRNLPEVEAISYSCGCPLLGSNNQSGHLNGESVSFNEVGIDSSFAKVFDIPLKHYTSAAVRLNDGVAVDYTHFPTWLDEKLFNVVNPDTVTLDMKLYDSDAGNGIGRYLAGTFPPLKFVPITYEQQPLLFFYPIGNRRPWHLSIALTEQAPIAASKKKIEKILADTWQLPTLEVKSIDDLKEEYYKSYSQLAALVFLFALLSLLIATMGVFAMSVYLMEQRRREVALRRVFGASIGNVLLIVAKGLRLPLAIASIAAAILAYVGTQKWLVQFPEHIAQPWLYYLMVSLLVAALALLSVLVLTLRMARKNPIQYLGSE